MSKFDPDGAEIYQAPRGWFASDQYDWLAGPFSGPAAAADALAIACRAWQAAKPKETGDAWTGGFADNH